MTKSTLAEWEDLQAEYIGSCAKRGVEDRVDRMSWRGRSANSTRWGLVSAGAHQFASFAGRAYSDRGVCRGVHGSPGQGRFPPFSLNPTPIHPSPLVFVRTSQRAASKPRSWSCLRRVPQSGEKRDARGVAKLPFGQERVRPFVQQDGGDIEFVRNSLELDQHPEQSKGGYGLFLFFFFEASTMQTAPCT